MIKLNALNVSKIKLLIIKGKDVLELIQFLNAKSIVDLIDVSSVKKDTT